MTALLTIVHVVVCLILIVAILLQSGKAADLAGAFGGGGSQTAFGPRSTQSLMSKVTEVCAIIFMLTSLGLWIFSGREGASAVKGVTAPAPAKTEAPVTKPAVPKTEEKTAAATSVPSDKTAEQKPAAADATKK
ncbi:MAG: preprotein translocase subunit SecG [Candidatus Aminicenantales bacterium]